VHVRQAGGADLQLVEPVGDGDPPARAAQEVPGTPGRLALGHVRGVPVQVDLTAPQPQTRGSA
jgi:hypothetical protein